MDAAPGIAVDSFRLGRCVECSYDLTGHPAAGVCPECGERYDAETIEFVGFARGSHETILNAPPTRFRQQVLFVSPMVLGVTTVIVWSVIMVRDSWRTQLPFMLLVAASVLTPVVRFLRRCIRGRATARLRMSFAGVVQEDDADGEPTTSAIAATLPFVMMMMYAAFMFSMNLGGWWFSALFALLLALPTLVRAIRNRFSRRQRTRIADTKGLVASARRRFHLPTHWDDVQQVNIGMEDDQRCRVVITSKFGMKIGNKGDIADIEIPFTPEQAGQLRVRVTAWREYWRNRAASEARP